MRLTVLVMLAASGFAQTSHQEHHPPRSATEYADHLEAAGRRAWQMPDRVVEALALRSDEVVADIGAGTGYFTRRIARQAARVYAVDIEAELLEKAAALAPDNVETILATPDDPKLPPNAVDTIFICNVLHHIHHRDAYYQKLRIALKAGGRIVIVDFHKKELPVGPPPSMKLTGQEVIDELTAAGFKKSASYDFLPYQYFIEFRRD